MSDSGPKAQHGDIGCTCTTCHIAKRRSHKKSRNGCRNCKKRRIKCDEIKPRCGQCLKATIQCDFAPPGSSPESQESLAEGGILPPAARKRGRPRKHCDPATSQPPTKELDLSLLDMESLQSSPDALSLPPVPETIPAFPEPTWTWTVDDLELQHHYLGVMEHFANGMPMRREEVLRLSFRHHCVLHLMLAVSAMHLSRHSPEKARHWEEVADGHYTVGLRQVMEMLPTLNKDNCGAMYAASTLVCTYSFASRPSTGHLLLVSDGAEVAWLELLRGVRFVAETMGYDAIFSGELTPLPSDADKGGWPPEQTRARVVEWGLPFKTVSDVISAAGGPEFEVYEKMLTTLSDCFEETFGTAEQPKYTTNGKLQCVIGWVYRTRDAFIQCLKDKKPASLLILAHFAVVLKTLEWLWYVDGWAGHLLHGVALILGPRYGEYLRWPREEMERLEEDRKRLGSA